MRAALRDWRSSERRTTLGAVESEQRAVSTAAVVEASEAGARRLGEVYWAEVSRAVHGVVRLRRTAAGIELRLLGGPLLLRFAAAELGADGERVWCRYPITGGVLARQPAGSLTLSQTGRSDVVLASAIEGFFPTLAGRPGADRPAGALYTHLQARIHIALTRRYFRRLIAEATR